MDGYKSLMEISKTKLVVIDFSAEWCGPCKYIGPIFEKLSDEIDTVVFAKVDVDEADDVAGLCGISAMPTFQFFRNGQKVDEVMGANVDALNKKIAQHK
ncbi:thioredoxin 1 [Fistulifera solaris]|uniref:Thioredoxin 1 n=1 Tax=Fistulifera solaris TaxID=1519565 RepID=A0A1Z5K2P9_FISSO|nr:thioredoxin 1 [Fistulifera solaris]|eukprot:GAX20331.1 thioredoxin 1 [Fistulifera solaris]